MPRTKLEAQPSYEFSCTIGLQPRDINYADHLGNDSLVSIIGTARASMFRSMGLREGDLGDGRTGIIMADLTVNFKAEAFMFDELQIDTHVGEMSRTGFRIFHRITKGVTVIAFAETGVVAFDYSKKRIGHVTETLINRLNDAQQKAPDSFRY
jgi:acyl-CoA thioester hydrolase